MSEGTSSDRTGPAIVLVEPQLGENIGTAARAMANFGLTDLRLVTPREGWPNERRGRRQAAPTMCSSASGSIRRSRRRSPISASSMPRPRGSRDLAKDVAGPAQGGRDAARRWHDEAASASSSAASGPG